MLLVIDVGNTRIHLGLYQKDELLEKLSFETEFGELPDKEKLDSFLKKYPKISAVAIASVVAKISSFFKEYFHSFYHLDPFFVSAKCKMEMKLDCDVPEEVGPDLIADCYASRIRYHSNVLIADLGTASKLIYLDGNGNFKGVSILPGLRMGLKALSSGTDALPSFPIRPIEKAIGTNTEECILSGVLLGSAYAIEGLANRFEEEANFKGRRILTGGNAVYVNSILKDFEWVETLSLEGIKAIQEYQ